MKDEMRTMCTLYAHFYGSHKHIHTICSHKNNGNATSFN